MYVEIQGVQRGMDLSRRNIETSLGHNHHLTPRQDRCTHSIIGSCSRCKISIESSPPPSATGCHRDRHGSRCTKYVPHSSMQCDEEGLSNKSTTHSIIGERNVRRVDACQWVHSARIARGTGSLRQDTPQDIEAAGPCSPDAHTVIIRVSWRCTFSAHSCGVSQACNYHTGG
ncbi:hypothetical protein FA13DRAFT_799575 [Coprinellus micaceus]|uniref:Uncharacterized protein n=1 Tax=Coprinellus micaceus TaxID=71717 RepID=A0A4Y7S5L2_COPMI|nr:hypothetical protein FA13DRAFT_799575 [Coprinellus micaceus]